MFWMLTQKPSNQGWSFVNAGTVTYGAGVGTSIPMPAGISPGDLLLVIEVNNTVAFNLELPSPWSKLVESTAANDSDGSRINIWGKYADGSETTVASVSNVATSSPVVSLAYSGLSSIDNPGGYGNITASSIPTTVFSTQTAPTLVLSVFSSTFTTATWTAPGGVNTRVTANPVTSNQRGLLICDENMTTVAATTARTASIGTSMKLSSYAMAFR